MEIKQLLAIMTANVEEGRNVHHGLVSIDGIVDINHPEKVFVKPHTYITFDEFREIRNTNDHNTALNRLNLAIDKIVKNWTGTAKLPTPELTPPKGYVFSHAGTGTYSDFVKDGYTDEQMTRCGWLVLVGETPQVTPRPRPEAPPMPPVPLKPYIYWMASDCINIWPKSDYEFFSYDFNFISNPELKAKLIEGLNLCVANGRPLRLVSDMLSLDGFKDVPYSSIQDKLNQLYRGLSASPPPMVKPYINWVSTGCNHVWPDPDYKFGEIQFIDIKPAHFRVDLVTELDKRVRKHESFAGAVYKHYLPSDLESITNDEMEQKVNNILNQIYQGL